MVALLAIGIRNNNVALLVYGVQYPVERKEKKRKEKKRTEKKVEVKKKETSE